MHDCLAHTYYDPTQLVLVAIAGMFLFERIPMNVTATGVLSHLVYMTLLKSFPNCSFSSLSFIGSLGVWAWVCWLSTHNTRIYTPNNRMDGCDAEGSPHDSRFTRCSREMTYCPSRLVPLLVHTHMCIVCFLL